VLQLEFSFLLTVLYNAFSALTLLVGWQEGHPAFKKTERWGAFGAVCLERGADLHMAQLMPLPLTVSCFSRTQIGCTFLVPAHPGRTGQRAVKRVYVNCAVGRRHLVRLVRHHLGPSRAIVDQACRPTAAVTVMRIITVAAQQRRQLQQPLASRTAPVAWLAPGE